MQQAFANSSKIEPFEFQNQSVYRDLLRLISTIREVQSESKSDLGKRFLEDLFNALFFVSKDIAYASIIEDPMLKMQVYASCVTKTFDCIAALDICFEARWIPSLQYFESKQILEKAYWAFKDEQKIILSCLKGRSLGIKSNKNEQYQ